jgi:hypothetical protein
MYLAAFTLRAKKLNRFESTGIFPLNIVIMICDKSKCWQKNIVAIKFIQYNTLSYLKKNSLNAFSISFDMAFKIKT